MKKVTLLSANLVGGKPTFPKCCVVCGEECVSSVFLAVADGSAGSVFREIFRWKPGFFVPAHQRRECSGRLVRWGMQIQGFSNIWIIAYALVTVGLALRFGKEWIFYSVVALLPFAMTLMLWGRRRKLRMPFVVDIELDATLRGLLTFQFENDRYAEMFEEANRLALWDEYRVQNRA